MRRRFALLSTLVVLGVALTMPATALAAGVGYEYVVKYNYCRGADPHFKVKHIAYGFTNTNKLTNESWVERRPGGSKTWTKIYTWATARYKFAINGDKHWLTSWRRYNGSNDAWYRIAFRLRAWHNRTLLAEEVLYSVKC